MENGVVQARAPRPDVKQPRFSRITKAEGVIFTAAFGSLLFFLLLSLFLAQRYLIETAHYWDFLRVERYLRLCQMALESEARAWPSEESLQKLRDIGLYPDVYPPDHEIPQPNPRYVPAIQSVEMWGHIRDAAGKPVAVLRLSRHDINTRHTIKTVRIYTLVGAVGGTILIAAIWLALRRTLIRRARLMIGELHEQMPQAAATAAEDPLDHLSGLLREMLDAQKGCTTQAQKLLTGHSEAACVGTAEGILREVNAAYCRMFGKTRDELVGSNYLDLIPPSDRGEVVANLRRLSSRHPVNTVEHRVVLPDGSQRWMRWRDEALFNENGNVVEITSFGTDITTEKQLEDRMAGLQLAFDQMQSLAETGSLTWDLSTDHMQWTDETFRLLGLERGKSPPSLAGLLQSVMPEDRGPLQQLLERARDDGDSFEHVFRAVRPDGSCRVLQSRAEVRADPKTKLLSQLTCTLRDITDLREAESATRRELRLREAIEQSLAAGITASDNQGRILLVNPAFCAMTGFSSDELAGATAPYPYWPEEEISNISRAFESALAGQTPPQGYELRFCRKDGTRFDVLVKVAPLLDSEDKHLGWLGAVTDISAIQQTRRELLKAEAVAQEELQYRQAVEKAITVGLIAINKEGRPISVNEAYCRMFGYTRREIMAMAPPYPLWPEDEQEKIQNAFAQHLAGQSPPEGFSLRFKKKDGRLVDVLITASTLYDAHGQVIGVLSALTDITPLQEAQRRLHEANERLQIAQDVAEFGIWDWDPVNDTLHWDHQSFAIFGRPDATDAEEVWHAVHREEERERLTYELRRLIKTGGSSGQDRLRARWPDGTLHDILSTYVILRDEAGRAVRVVGINRDVTAELEEERELRHANERLAAALEGGRFGTFEHIFGVGAVNWNAVNYEIHGIDPSLTDPDELFRAWRSVVGSDYEAIEQAVSSLPIEKNSLSYDFSLKVPGSRESRRVRSSVFIERNSQGHPVRLVGVSRRID